MIARTRAVEFPWATDGQVAFLDHASTGPLPTRARRAIESFGLRRAEPFRLKAEDLFPVLARTRAEAAQLLGAPAGSIALSTNTSHGVNLAARTLPYGKGDIVLSTDGEFPANVYPWMAACRERGAEFRMLPLAGHLPDEEALLRAITSDPRVKGVAISWVSYWSGHRFDLNALSAACRARGIWLFVDAIQGVGAVELDLAITHIDMLACGAQKWLLSPWGTGFTYVHPSRVQALEPAEVGWLAQRRDTDFRSLLDYDATWHDDARRFEVVTLDFVNFAAMAESLSLFNELGVPRTAEAVRHLANHALLFADANPSVALITPREMARRAGVLAFRVADLDGTSKRLREANVFHAVREGCIRLAPHWYNTVADLDRALNLLIARN